MDKLKIEIDKALEENRKRIIESNKQRTINTLIRRTKNARKQN